MLFNSQPFVLGFLPVALAGFFLAGRFGSPRLALGALVAASLFFYAWWNPPFVLLPAASIVGNYFVGQRIFRL
ncbi:MAG: MBOAT family O-acyltransferase, partial [Acetobacteraceae bacterium]